MCTKPGLNGMAAPMFTRQVSKACALPPGRSTTVAWGAVNQVRWVDSGNPLLVKKASPG